MLPFILTAILVIILLVVLTNTVNSKPSASGTMWETGERRYGRRGEQIAADIIRKVLRGDDVLYRNVSISFEGKPTELDTVVVNQYGVFIIEVKNYKGRLYGNEDDFEWQKYKDDGYGNTFEMRVKNPIKQVKRQTYILAQYLNYYGAKVWVEGYALLIHGNSPVKSRYILSSVEEIDAAIHTYPKRPPDHHTIARVKDLLGKENALK